MPAALSRGYGNLPPKALRRPKPWIKSPKYALWETDPGSTRHNISSANKACQLVVSVEGFLSRADVRDLVERRREAARIRSGYYDYLPPWARPVW